MRREKSGRVAQVLWLMALLLGAGALAVGAAQAGGAFRQPASVIASGGGPAASGSFREAASVIGQPTEGGLSTAAGYRNWEGFIQPPPATSAAGRNGWMMR